MGVPIYRISTISECRFDHLVQAISLAQRAGVDASELARAREALEVEVLASPGLV